MEGGAGNATDMKSKFAELKRVKEENESTEKERDDTARNKFEEHEQVVSADPRDHATGTLTYWWPEDPQFWKRWGNCVGGPNLGMSTLCVLCLSAVWYQWVEISRVIKEQKAADPTSYDGWGSAEDVAKKADAIPQCAFLSGAIMRLVNAFMTGACGGRAHTILNLLTAIIPMIGISVFMSSHNVPELLVCLMAIISGIGSGGCASCLNHISNIYPKAVLGCTISSNYQCSFLGMAFAAGTAPLIASVGVCSANHRGMCKTNPIGEKYPFNLGVYFGVFLLAVLSLAARSIYSCPDQSSGNKWSDARSWKQLNMCGLLPAILCGIVWQVLIATQVSTGISFIAAFGLSFVAFGVVLFSMTYLIRPALKEKVRPQLQILKAYQTWRLIFLHVMAGGMLLVFADAFPKVVGLVFYVDGGDGSSHTWGPFIVAQGSVYLGGWLSDKKGGSVLTLWTFIILAIQCAVAGVIVHLAVGEAPDSRGGMFIPFFVIMYLIFFLAGISCGSTLRQVSVLCPPETRGNTLGVVTAAAGFAFFIFSVIFAGAAKDDLLLYIFAVVAILYIIGAFVNFWFFHRAAAENPC